MTNSMVRNWWVLAVRGVLAIIVGLIALVSPNATLFALVVLFGVYALFDGVSLLFMAFSAGQTHRWWLVLEGVLGIGAGIVAFAFPFPTAIALVFLIGWWALITGVLEITAAFSMHQKLVPAWLLVVAGVLSVILGVFLLVTPDAGALSLVWSFGVYSLAAGIALLVFAFRLRGIGSTHTQSARAT